MQILVNLNGRVPKNLLTANHKQNSPSRTNLLLALSEFTAARNGSRHNFTPVPVRTRATAFPYVAVHSHLASSQCNAILMAHDRRLLWLKVHQIRKPNAYCCYMEYTASDLTTDWRTVLSRGPARSARCSSLCLQSSSVQQQSNVFSMLVRNESSTAVDSKATR